MSEQLIVCRGLCKAYGRKPALSGVDLEVGRGRIVGLLGPNGSGKTTLIKLLCGLLQPTEGEIEIGGLPVGVETKAQVSYLPDRMYFANWCGRWTCSTCSGIFTGTLTTKRPLPCAAAWGWSPRTG